MDRLWDRTDRNTDCWMWQGGKDRKGYGLISVNGKMMRAHRLAWELTYGSIPHGLCVCHHCDHPACINPEHLFVGTNLENMQDKVRKGHPNGGIVYGERNGASKLTSLQVEEIRHLHTTGISDRKLAVLFCIGKSQVNRIVNNLNWR